VLYEGLGETFNYTLNPCWLSCRILKIRSANLLESTMGTSGCLANVNLTILKNKCLLPSSVDISVQGKNKGGWPIRKNGNTDT
jgi:hypothetical protein